jgi:hypothetical protein
MSGCGMRGQPCPAWHSEHYGGHSDGGRTQFAVLEERDLLGLVGGLTVGARWRWPHFLEMERMQLGL